MELPASVRYVKNGRGSQWWPESKVNGEVHLGWKNVPKDLLSKPDFAQIEKFLRSKSENQKGVTQDFNALRTLLDSPSKHLWVTFEDGFMWWCTVRDGAVVNPNGEGDRRGNFWLVCDRKWSDESIKGKKLVMRNLPGTVTRTAGFRATVCEPMGQEAILRIIRGEIDADVTKSESARGAYTKAVLKLIERLPWQDFEDLISLILDRTGWRRISAHNPISEGTDVDAENPATGEVAFVQVKSVADQGVLNDYVDRFKKRSDCARMIFAVHTPKGTLVPPPEFPTVHLWTGDRIAELVVRLGLGDWLEDRFA